MNPLYIVFYAIHPFKDTGPVFQTILQVAQHVFPIAAIQFTMQQDNKTSLFSELTKICLNIRLVKDPLSLPLLADWVAIILHSSFYRFIGRY